MEYSQQSSLFNTVAELSIFGKCPTDDYHIASFVGCTQRIYDTNAIFSKYFFDFHMLKEPVILKAKSSLSSPSSQCPSSILQGKPSDRNVCCGDGFFRTTDPSRNGGFFQKRDTEMTASEFDNAAKSSIHSIMKKKSPCRGRSEL